MLFILGNLIRQLASLSYLCADGTKDCLPFITWKDRFRSFPPIRDIRIDAAYHQFLLPGSRQKRNPIDPNTIFYEVDLEIIGIFHVNTTQIVSEYTVEPDIAENFMFADVNVTQEARRAYFEAVDLHKEPPYQKVTFFVKDPKDLDRSSP